MTGYRLHHIFHTYTNQQIMGHLALEIFNLSGTGSKFAALPENAEITITENSEIFAQGDVWSHTFKLNVYANAHIFATAGEIHGQRLHEQFNKRRMRLWAEGIPMFLGYLKLDAEVEVDSDGNVEMSFESGKKTFDELIEGAKANQVPLLGDVQFGMALWRKRWVYYGVKLRAKVEFGDGETDMVDINGGDYIAINVDGEQTPMQQYPRMVLAKGSLVDKVKGDVVKFNYLNTDEPYAEDEDGTPTHPYCNIALCYQKYGYTETDLNGNPSEPNYSAEPVAQRGYEMMPANRVNSAPNFFVAYWLKALMKHLGIYIEENQMMEVEDLRRLFFVNSNCAYDIPENMRRTSDHSRFGKYTSGRKGEKNYKCYVPEYIGNEPTIDLEESHFPCKYRSSIEVPEGYWENWEDDEKTIKNVTVEIAGIRGWGGANKVDPYRSADYELNNRYFHNAFATSECFPDVDISEVISALESAFGLRFLFSDDYRRVRIVLLRNIFQDSEVQELVCEGLQPTKVENNIRGFRMTYGDTEDTHFYYKGFSDKLPHMKKLWPDNSDKHDYSQWSLDSTYSDIISEVSAFDKTCYITPVNGNAYGIKIDQDAKRYRELHPAVFEYAGYMDAEDGDCTGEEETIKTINMGFTPAIMNDLNMEAERKSGSNKQRFALFADETMRPRRLDYKKDNNVDFNASDAEYDVNDGLYAKDPNNGIYLNAGQMSGGYIAPGQFTMKSDLAVKKSGLRATITRNKEGYPAEVQIKWNLSIDIDGYLNEGYRLYLQDNFEPNDDGVSPIEQHKWGLMLGIMRGSGSDASVAYSIDPDDRVNDTWEIEPGSSISSHPDTCDNYGGLWDYDVKADNRTIQARYLWAAGWTVEGGYDDLVPLTTNVEMPGKTVFVCTPIKYFRPGTRPDPDPVLTSSQLTDYVADLFNDHFNDIQTYDRWKIILSVKEGDKTFYSDGRISLKLRAEKPNPNYDPNQPETDEIVTTKEQAGAAMKRLFTSANTNLLARPIVKNETMRAAGWDAPGDGYATVMSSGYGVEYKNGEVHEILWTPIKPDGSVLTKLQLQAYVNSFNGLASSAIIAHDTQHLILDIDTTDNRAEILHRLQAIYYANGNSVGSFILRSNNPRYLTIDNQRLRRRGLADQFYKEYSKWVREARIIRLPVSIDLAQLLNIDKTKRVKIGGVIGFVRKKQYSISNKTGLGNVTLEIMYI